MTSFSRRKLLSLRNLAGFITGIVIGFVIGWWNLSMLAQVQIGRPVIEGKTIRTFSKPCVNDVLINDNVRRNDELDSNKLSSSNEKSIQTILNDESAQNNFNNLPKNQEINKQDVLHERDNSKNSKQENFLYVGVITAKKYLPTRGRAIYDTWGRHVPGKVEFYVGGAGDQDNEAVGGLSIVRLPTVDDNAYPPQKKSFMVLKHMYDNYLAGYQWFMRADDDVYLKPDRLENFLRKLNSSELHYIGQTGMGNEEERGKLSLNYGENYCMGGPGMVFSREVIRRVAPNIKYCLQHLYTWHEDVEISRCVRQFAGVNCVWSYEMKNLFHEHYSVRKGFIDPTESSESAMDIERAITMHPNKKPEYQRKLHLHITKGKMAEKMARVRDLTRDVISMDALWGGASDMDEFMLGIQPSLRRFVPLKSEDVQVWQFFTNYVYSPKASMPRQGLPKHILNAAKSIVMSIMLDLNSKSMARGRVIEFQKITYGYLRVNPLFGAEYVLDILLRYNRYRGKKVVIPVRRHAYLQQTFAKTILHEEHSLDIKSIRTYLKKLKPRLLDTLLKHPASALANIFNSNNQNSLYPDGEDTDGQSSKQPTYLTTQVLNAWYKSGKMDTLPLAKSKPINIIVPLNGRFDTFRKFMKNLENIAWLHGDPVNVLIMLFMPGKESQSDMHLSQLLIQDYSDRYPEREIRYIPVAGEFSRGLALEIGAMQYSNNSLLFLCDVDVIFDISFVNRCRYNTVQGHYVYYPVLFSQFQTASTTASVRNNPYLLDKNFGYWRNFGYGLLCVYQSDFAASGGYDTSIKGWGLEDVDLFAKFVSQSLPKENEEETPVKRVTARAMRVEEPGLIHIYHTVKCDPNLQESRLRMCSSSRASGIRSTWDLANEWDLLVKKQSRVENGGEIIDPENAGIMQEENRNGKK